MGLQSHVGFSCVNKHSLITLAISLALLRFFTSDGGKGEIRQEQHSRNTMACGRIHERRASWNKIVERCKESSISPVLLDRRFPRDC